MRVEVLRIYCDAEPGEFRGTVAVVIDMLRATTSIVHHLARGVREVIPADGHDEAFRIRDGLRDSGRRLVLAGERSGLPVPGFDFGNSPVEIDRSDLAGATVVLSTTNGTRALRHAAAADRVLAGCLNNGPALVERLAAGGAERVLLVCSGDSGGFSPEDHFGAGFLAEGLIEGGASAGDGAEEAVSAWRAVRDDPAAAMGRAPHGRELLSLGFAGDIACAAEIGSHATIPVMSAGSMVAAGPGEALS